ncbi:class D sortase [Oceanobacillus sp. M65]|uniref:class D sortase n=1 Tax=Oceanobacillus sp. M65 TaxID=3457435 RepID=UPI003FCE4CEB
MTSTQKHDDSLARATKLVSQNENTNEPSNVKSAETVTVQDESGKDKIFSSESVAGSLDFNSEIGEEIGLLLISKIDATLPIVEGVSEDELKKGVGHYDGTAFPSEPGQIVLSGHRDTVFRRMGELEIGDELLVRMPYGDFTYVMEKTEIVSADDLTVIRPHDYDEEMLTITTCYPFRYIGSAPDRYIVYAKPKR